MLEKNALSVKIISKLEIRNKVQLTFMIQQNYKHFVNYITA